MKKIVLTLAMTLGASVTANAGFGLSNLASKVTESTTGTSSQNIDLAGFFTQAKATNEMFIQSRAILATFLMGKEEAAGYKVKLQALKSTSDPKEKEAIIQDLKKSSDQVLDSAKKDEQATIEKLKGLDSQQKQRLLGAATNFGVASLMAIDLGKSSSQVTMGLASNPSSLASTGLSLASAKGLVGDITGIAKNSSLALVQFPQLFKKAGIEFKAPESTKTKPVAVEI